MVIKNFKFIVKRSDHNRKCKFEKCYYYNPNAKTFCCDACSSDAFDDARLKKEVQHVGRTE